MPTHTDDVDHTLKLDETTKCSAYCAVIKCDSRYDFDYNLITLPA